MCFRAGTEITDSNKTYFSKRLSQIGCLLDVMKLFANVLKINHDIEKSDL